jgi:hypothetical protein
VIQNIALPGNLCMLSHCWNFLGPQGNSVVLGPKWDEEWEVLEMMSEVLEMMLEVLEMMSESVTTHTGSTPKRPTLAFFELQLNALQTTGEY